MTAFVGDIRVVEAGPEDGEWVKRRVVESSVYSIPFGRAVDNDLVRCAAEADFENLVAGEDEVVVLLAKDRSQQRLGLLILNLSHRSEATGERQSLIEDLDVDPQFWGSPAVNRLVNRAAQVTAEHGLKYMIGHVSEGNRRTLLKSLRLGFQIERYHLAMGCTEDGPAPLPGRHDAQKAHDVSRAQRKLLLQRKQRRKGRKKR